VGRRRGAGRVRAVAARGRGAVAHREPERRRWWGEEPEVAKRRGLASAVLLLGGVGVRAT
jgi:hypothetical protein